MEEKTIIQIRKETAKRLKKLRIAELETYDEIINRLIDFYEKAEEEHRK
jgi:hypothetical protein